jgi:hypothetical protein
MLMYSLCTAYVELMHTMVYFISTFNPLSPVVITCTIYCNIKEYCISPHCMFICSIRFSQKITEYLSVSFSGWFFWWWQCFVWSGDLGFNYNLDGSPFDGLKKDENVLTYHKYRFTSIKKDMKTLSRQIWSSYELNILSSPKSLHGSVGKVAILHAVKMQGGREV